MELETFNGAAIVALTCTVVYVFVARTWNAATRVAALAPNFPERNLHEAAQRFREEFDRVSSKQSTYLGGVLVFATLFATAWFLDAGRLVDGYPWWQLYLQLGFFGIAGGYALFRLCMTIAQRRRIRFIRDANIAIGHQLQQLPPGFAHVYHDIPTSAGVVDHVLVGQSGVYAVSVIALRSRKLCRAQLDRNEIRFSTSGQPVSIVNIAARAHRLQKEMRELTGSSIRVRSVIAVPGWDVDEQTSDEHLLVNERTIGMLSGWKEQSDYLLNEDVDAIRNELVERCSKNRKKLS